MGYFAENIKTVPIGDVKPYPGNPRINKDAVAKVAASLREFGWKQPIVVDSDMVVIVGHTRLLAAKKNGDKTVQVLVATDLTPEQAKAYRLADNKTAEFAAWDDKLLNIELLDLEGLIDMEPFGFAKPEPTGAVEDEYDVDQVAPAVAQRGDLFALGSHRLLCGDSTSLDDVARLMDGKKAVLCYTDPPYNVAYGENKTNPRWKTRQIMNDKMTAEDFVEFCHAFMLNIAANVSGCVYISGPPGPDGRIMFTQADQAMHCSTTIIWNKDRFVLGLSKYQNQYEPMWFGYVETLEHFDAAQRYIEAHEPIWFGWADSGADYRGDRKQTNVWNFDRPRSSKLHPTMKPIALIGRAIEDASRVGDIVLDLFGGSGSTMIAAEQLQRPCYMMELDPVYVDTIIARWEELTGQKAVKL